MMELASRSSPSLWAVLLWKEFQQVKQTLVAVSLGLFCVQLMLVLIGFNAGPPENKIAAYGGTIQLACVAPILIALGCAGLLIGQERQTGTWAWSSSLPMTWQQALVSKLGASFFCSLAVTIPLSIVPIWLHLAGYLTTANSLNGASLGMALMIFLETIVVCFLATLIIKETLNALVVAGVVMVLLEACVWAAVHSLQDSGFKLTNEGGSLYLVLSVVWLIKSALLGLLLMPIAFRWRWGVGQQAVLAVARNTSPLPLGRFAKYRFQTGKAPSEWRMMLQHSLANSMWLRIVVALATLTITFIAPWDAMAIIFCVSFYLFGISTFEGDQSQSRIRFLADRGATPWKLVAGRLLIAAMIPSLVMLLSIAISIAVAGPHHLFATMKIWTLVPVTFLTGAFASMCFRKSIIATTLGVIVQALWIAALVLAAESSYRILSMVRDDFSSQMKLAELLHSLTPLSSIAILAAIFVLSHRWLVRDDAKLDPHFLWISLVALLSPIFLTATISFLFIPNTPWREVATSDPNSNSKSPSISLVEHPFLFDSMEMNLKGFKSAVLDEARIAKQDPSQEVMAFIKSLLVSTKEDLKSERKAVDLDFRYRYFDSSLSHVIVRTAALASICLDNKDPESSLQFWRANRDLQQFARRFDPQWTSPARAMSMQMLLSLSDDDVAALGGFDVVRGLIPSAANERTEKIHHIWLSANRSREYIRDSSFAYFPPLLWRVERQVAYDSNQSIKQLPTGPEDYLTGQHRELLLKRYP